MKNVNLAEQRIGQVRKNKFGSLMEVVEYRYKDDIWVKFLEHGNLVHTQWKHFSSGGVKNPYDKSVYEIGYIGEGIYKPIENKQITQQYASWHRIFDRCYDYKNLLKNPTYNGCIIAEEWHNFQNFAKWYDENYYQIDGEIMCLDKDILVKDNKIYSPETCVFVPKSINSLFVKTDAKRGELPIGVSWSNSYKKFVAQCGKGKNGDSKFFGHYNTPEEAFESYRFAKEKKIKLVANDYKNKIPNNLYNAMINYSVEITD